MQNDQLPILAVCISCLWSAVCVCGQNININVFMRNVASIMKLSMKLQLFNIYASAVM